MSSKGLPLALVGLTLLACTTTDSVEQTEDVDSYIMGLPKLEVAPAQPKTQIDCAGACPADEQDGQYACSYSRFTETAAFDKFVAFAPNSATLWPGVVVRGKDAAQGVLTPIGVDLAPVTFSVSLENLGASPVGKMKGPSLSAFREQRNEILASGVTGATPAALDFEIVEISSESQLGVSIGADVNWPGGPDIAASFDFDSQSRKTKMLVNFTQAYYTVDVDTHNKPSDFFAPGTSIEELEPWFTDESPPVYVQSITYGRRVIFSVQTDYSASELQAALEASYSAAVASGNVSVATQHKNVLAQSTIRAFVLGGSGDDATGAIQGVDGLMQYIRNGGSYSQDSPGAPIAYKLAYLDNAVTQLAFTSDYAERTCVQNRANVRFDLASFEHLGGADTGGQIELRGQVPVRYPTPHSTVTDINTGGKLAHLWKMDDGSWISFDEFTTYTPSSPQYIEVQNVPITGNPRICLIADMWEDDSSEFNPDDDFGIAGLMIGLDDWGGTHHVVTHGTGENSIDVGITITVD